MNLGTTDLLKIKKNDNNNIFERRNYPLILTMVALPPPYEWRQSKSNLSVMIGEMSIISTYDNIYISSVLRLGVGTQIGEPKIQVEPH